MQLSELHQSHAMCTREQADVLVHFDHHRVRVGERWGILPTHFWY